MSILSEAYLTIIRTLVIAISYFNRLITELNQLIVSRMALIRDGFWSIVNGTEIAPDRTAEAALKFASRRYKAIAVIVVLSVDPSLLLLLGNPEDSREVWTKLEEQFQRKTWANKL